MAPPPFRLFGWDHLAALAGIAGLCAMLVVLRDRLDEQARSRLGQVLAVGVLAYIANSYYQVWRNGLLTWDYALPLHLCNVLVLLVLYTLLRPSQRAGEVIYYWSVGGSLHALITPDLLIGWPSWDYVQFFVGHGLLMVAMAYLVGVRRLYPEPGGVRRAFVALNVWVVIVGALDAIFGWNYGYLCRKPLGASLLDHLGPWPWYVLAGESIALLSFWVLSLPWRAWWRRRPA